LKFPNTGRANIAPEKLRDYLLNPDHLLLNPDHPENGGKACPFAALGYSRDNWMQLADDFRSQHLTEEALEARSNA
jgi:hypothetical protein